MTPLLSLLLTNPSHGLWRVTRFESIHEELVATFNRSVLLVDHLAVSDKDKMMDQLSEAFRFPDWFGRNWDALNDCLAERARSDDWPDLVVFRPVRSDLAPSEQNLATLADITAEVAAESHRWFLMVGAKPESVPKLPVF